MALSVVPLTAHDRADTASRPQRALADESRVRLRTTKPRLQAAQRRGNETANWYCACDPYHVSHGSSLELTEAGRALFRSLLRVVVAFDTRLRTGLVPMIWMCSAAR
jgi:hypothetical protein